jgi:hypothetical protein
MGTEGPSLRRLGPRSLRERSRRTSSQGEESVCDRHTDGAWTSGSVGRAAESSSAANPAPTWGAAPQGAFGLFEGTTILDIEIQTACYHYETTRVCKDAIAQGYVIHTAP